MTIFGVRHVTTYRYHRPVGFGEHHLMFRPRDSSDQRLYRADLTLIRSPARALGPYVFGNCVALVTISRPATELRFETRIVLDHTPQAAPDLQIDKRRWPIPSSTTRTKPPTWRPPSGAHYPDDEVAHWARQFVRATARPRPATC